MANTLIRWDPFRDLVSIQDELNRLFGRAYAGAEGLSRVGGNRMPSLDMYETPEKYVAKVALGGIDPDKVEVSVEDSTPTISGQREFYDEVNEEQFHRVERRFGSFARSVSLPPEADPEGIEASFDKGVLTIDVPRSEKVKPRRITVKAKK